MKSIGNKSYTIPDKPHDFIGGQFSPKKYVHDIEYLFTVNFYINFFTNCHFQKKERR